MGNFNRNMFLIGLSGFFVLSVVCFFAIYTAVPDAQAGFEIIGNDETNNQTTNNSVDVTNSNDTIDNNDTTNNSFEHANSNPQSNFVENDFDLTNESVAETEPAKDIDTVNIDENEEEEEDADADIDTDEIELVEENNDTSSETSSSTSSATSSSTSSATSSSTSSDTSSSTSSATSSSTSSATSSSTSSATSSSTSSTTSSSTSSTTSSSTSTINTQEYVQLPNVSSTDNGTQTVSIIAAGDNLIHTGIYTQAAARSSSGYNFDPAYENVKSYIQAADIASINQETVMSKSYGPSSYPLFNTPVEMADTIKNLGFDVVSLSNNHVGDKGATGLYETLDLLKNEKGLVVSGSYFNQSDYDNIPIFEVNGIKISYLSASQWTNDLRTDTSTGLVTSYTEGEAEVRAFLAQVVKAKAISDIVVVNMHWGFENTFDLTVFQTGMSQRLVSSGADIIIGHHPHVLQPVEFIKKSDGTYAVCFYSVGNFISAQSYGERMIGGLADVTIARVDGKAQVVDAQLIPIITHYGSNYANISTYSYDNYSSTLANSHGVKELNTPAFSFDFIYNNVTNNIDSRFLPDEFISMYGGSSYSSAS